MIPEILHTFFEVVEQEYRRDPETFTLIWVALLTIFAMGFTISQTEDILRKRRRQRNLRRND